MTNFGLRQQEGEDALTFGRRLRFVEISLRLSSSLEEDKDEATEAAASLPWPCLHFASIVELLNVLQSKTSLLQERIACPHMLHRINVEFLRHLQQGGGVHDPVVFLFGELTPRGNRLVFGQNSEKEEEDTSAMRGGDPRTDNYAVSSSMQTVDDEEEGNSKRELRTNDHVAVQRTTLQLQDYKEAITAAIDQMQGEPCFMDALNETSPILAALLSEEMLCPNRMPGPDEHAPAA